MRFHEIIKNLYRIEIPLNHIPLGSVNIYVIKGYEKNLMVDAGLNSKESLEIFYAVLAELEIDLKRTSVFLTHSHWDHSGLLKELSLAGSDIYFNGMEEDLAVSNQNIAEEFEAFGRRNGFFDIGFDAVAAVVSENLGVRSGFGGDFHKVKEEDRLTTNAYRFTCIETPGHSRDHACLYEPSQRILFSGDLILEGSIPPIQFTHSQDWVPLRSYLEGLERIHALEIALILPGHKTPFTRYRERIQEIKAYHKTRCNEIVSILEDGEKNAFQVASRLKWKVKRVPWERLDLLVKLFCLGEVVAQLDYLVSQGSAGKRVENGVVAYSTC